MAESEGSGEDAVSAGAVRGFRRRRRNHPGGRDRKIEVKVTAAEEERLRAAAEHAGMSVQRLMVTRALAMSGAGMSPASHAAKVAAWTQANEIRNLISGIAVNMNQIARHANTEHEIPADFAPACEATRRASERVRDAFGEVFAVRFPATGRADRVGGDAVDGAKGSGPSAVDDPDPDEWDV